MRIKCTESFPTEPQGAEAAWHLIRRIVDARLADEIQRRLDVERADTRTA